MKRFIYAFVLVGLLPLIYGCVDTLSSQSSNPDGIVVNCLLNDGEVQTLRLTRSNNVEDLGDYRVVDDAIATLYSHTNTHDIEVGKFVNKGGGEYTLNYKTVPGSSYKLEIITSEGRKLYGMTIMPNAIPVLVYSINGIKEAIQNGEEDIFPDYGCPYSIYGYSGIINSLQLFILKESPLDNALWFCQLNSESDINQPLIAPSDDFKLSSKIYGGSVIIDNFNVIDSTTLTNNSTKSTFLLYCRLMPHTDEHYSNSSYWQTGNILFLDSSLSSIFCIRTVSEEYDKYMKSLITKALTFQDETGLSSMFDVSNVYTNIIGGYGIFGAYSEEDIFYDNGQFVNMYFAQSKENILRKDYKDYLVSIPWDEYDNYDNIYIFKEFLWSLQNK